MEPNETLSFQNVSKSYLTAGGKPFHALSDVSFSINQGRKVAIVGRSGSGKSTLLHLAAGIDLPSSGRIRVRGNDLSRLSEKERTLLRRETLGLVFQFFYLLPHLSVRDNIAIPELIAGSSPASYRDRVDHLLDKVGLLDRASDSVEKLSGGEMQRVAICRAMLRKPGLILADEPTGNLDDATASTVMDLLLELVNEENGTLIFVTHSRQIASLADETWRIHSGLLERD